MLKRLFALQFKYLNFQIHFLKTLDIKKKKATANDQCLLLCYGWLVGLGDGVGFNCDCKSSNRPHRQKKKHPPPQTH